MSNETLIIRWTGTARYSPSQAMSADAYRRELTFADPDGTRIGGRAGLTYSDDDGSQWVYVYWTKARAIVVRFHGAKVTP